MNTYRAELVLIIIHNSFKLILDEMPDKSD